MYAASWRFSEPLGYDNAAWGLPAGPAGTWGIYQTAAGTRFYLVQRDSKYDKNPFTLIIMR